MNLFAKGLFSARLNDPLRVDAKALLRLTVADLEDGFQVTSDNPLCLPEIKSGHIRDAIREGNYSPV